MERRGPTYHLTGLFTPLAAAMTLQNGPGAYSRSSISPPGPRRRQEATCRLPPCPTEGAGRRGGGGGLQEGSSGDKNIPTRNLNLNFPHPAGQASLRTTYIISIPPRRPQQPERPPSQSLFRPSISLALAALKHLPPQWGRGSRSADATIERRGKIRTTPAPNSNVLQRPRSSWRLCHLTARHHFPSVSLISFPLFFLPLILRTTNRLREYRAFLRLEPGTTSQRNRY